MGEVADVDEQRHLLVDRSEEGEARVVGMSECAREGGREGEVGEREGGRIDGRNSEIQMKDKVRGLFGVHIS